MMLPKMNNMFAFLLAHHHHLLLLLLLVFSSSNNVNVIVEAKKVSNSFKLSGAITEHTMTKFALSPQAKGKVTVQFHASQKYPQYTPSLKVYFYNSDRDWDKVSQSPTCEEKIRYAHHSETLKFYPEYISDDGKIKHSRSNGEHPMADKAQEFLEKAADMQKEFEETGSLNPNQKKKPGINWIANVDAPVSDGSTSQPQYWYIAVADCSLEISYRDNQIPELFYTLQIWDELLPDHTFTHLSHDEQGLIQIHLLNAILSFALAFGLFVPTFQRWRNNQELHVATLLVLSACCVHAFSSLCQAMHLYLYQSNGIGSYSLDSMSAHAEASVDSILCWILLAVAVGWTLPVDVSIRTNDHMKSQKFISQLTCLRRGFSYPNRTYFDLFRNPSFLIFLVVDGIHAILCQWGRIYNDDFDCFHDLEHLPGKLLLIFRMVLAIIFLASTAALKQHVHAPNLSKFLHFFSLIGFSWFLSLPSLALLISSKPLGIPLHRRHPIMTVLSMGLQVVSLMSLGWLFTATESASPYHKVANINDDGSGGSLGASGSSTSSGGGIGGVSLFKFGKTKIRLD